MYFKRKMEAVKMREYINNNRTTVVPRALVAGVFAVTAVIAILFDDVTPATMLWI